MIGTDTLHGANRAWTEARTISIRYPQIHRYANESNVDALHGLREFCIQQGRYASIGQRSVARTDKQEIGYLAKFRVKYIVPLRVSILLPEPVYFIQVHRLFLLFTGCCCRIHDTGNSREVVG
jgi:hypothetical protein